MKKFKGLLRNLLVFTLVIAMIVPNSFFAFAETEENTAKVDDSFVSDEKSTEETVSESAYEVKKQLDRESDEKFLEVKAKVQDTEKEKELAKLAIKSIEGEKYIDGVFSGKGKGLKGDITVTLTIDHGVIVDAHVEQNETPWFWDKAKVIIDTIKNMKNPSENDINSVEVVSGATYSSNGIKEAMKSALTKALGSETIFAGGEGTSKSPYIIANEVQLRNFAKSVNDGTEYDGNYIKLSSNIDLSASEWVPIGTKEHSFGGNFDGSGMNVENLFIGTSKSYSQVERAGLFGKLSDGASIKNVKLNNAKIYVVDESVNKLYGAGLVAISGKNNEIDRCIVTNSEIFVKSNNEKFTYAAGLVGMLDQKSTITNSFVDCKVHAESGNFVYAGGIAALTGNQALVMNNYSTGSVDVELLSNGKKATAVGGGIVGMASGIVYNCYANNVVTVTNHTTPNKVNKAGLVGWATGNSCVLNSCYDSKKTKGEPVIIFPAKSTIFEGSIDVRDQGSEEIADFLHSNLSHDNISAAIVLLKEKLPKKEFAFEENIEDKVFYDWEASEKKVLLSKNVWKENFKPETIFQLGTGIEKDPYMIQTEEQLRKFAVSLSNENTYAGKFIKLANDIDVSGRFWTCIGEGEYPFCGTFDGDHHVINGITIKGEDGDPYNAQDDVYFGLFGVVGKGGVIQDLGVTNVDINVYGKKTTAAGGICGLSAGGTIDSCYTTGTIKGQTTEKGNNYAGGLVGWAVNGYIVNSYTDTSVYSSVLPTALAMSGGIVGMTNRAVVANCYSLGKITGHTKRELEVVESMAAIGGLTGVAGSPVVNCYTMGDTVSEDYSYYVGSTIGWATGISEIYNVYYNTDSTQFIQSEKVSPISNIGWLVKQGINEEGEVYPGALTYDVAGKKAEEMKSNALAEKLNANFKAFPLSTKMLPTKIQLKKWTVKDGVVTFSDEYAERNYVEAPVEKPSLTGNYYNGTFYGRALKEDNNYLNVTVEVKDKKIISIISDMKFEGMDEVIQEALKSNKAPDIDEKDGTDLKSFKTALRKATLKALKGDYTDYSIVDSKIFAGGNGTKEDPFKISTPEQLLQFSAAVNEVEHFKDQYIILTNDIDLSNVEWVPVGGSGLYAFSGNFDGRGYKIKNMTIGSEKEPKKYSSAGLFANIDTATIKNVGIVDGYINISPIPIPGIIKERTYAGLIAGYVGIVSKGDTKGAVIDHCYGTGHIISSSIEHNYVGGLAGLTVHSAVTNSWSDCVIEAKSPGNWVYSGGLVGLPSFSIFLNNYAYGEIHTDATVNKTQLGGIGGMYSSYAFNNYTDVDLISKRQTGDIGAIAGRNTGIGYISHCYGNTDTKQKAGNKVTTGMNSVGGIVEGDRYGKGQIVESELKSSIDKSFVTLLNQNTKLIQKDQMYTELLKEWFIHIPNDLKFNTWVLKDGKVVFGEIASDHGNGGKSSKSSGGGSKSTSKNAEVSVADQTENKEKATVGEGVGKDSIQIPFVDIEDNAWYTRAVKYAFQNGIMNGVENNKFEPNTSMTRAMVSTILWNMEKKPIETGTTQFTDVENDSWYAKSIIWASKKGITSGVSPSMFAPNDPVTREQFAQFLYTYAKYKGYDVTKANDLSAFHDQPSSWAQEAIKWAVGNKIMNGKGDGILDPQGTATRAEIAQMIMKFNNN